MTQLQTSKSFRNFSKHLFIVSRVYTQKKKAREDLENYLHMMKKSIIRMNLSYSHIDKLKRKVENLVSWEIKYAGFFRQPDKEAGEQLSQLNNQIKSLEQEFKNERESKLSIISDYDEKIKEMTESLESIKSRMRHLLMEKAKRQQRLHALDHKINEDVDLDKYYGN